MAPDAEIFIGLFVRQGRRLCEISIAQSFDHAMVGFVFIDTDFAQLELIEIAQEVLVHRGRETFIGNGIKDVVFDIDMLNEEGNIVLGVMQDILDGIAITLLVGGDKLGEVANVVPSRNMIFQQRPDTVAIGWVEALLQGGEKHGLFFYMMAFIDKDGVEIDQRFEVPASSSLQSLSRTRMVIFMALCSFLSCSVAFIYTSRINSISNFKTSRRLIKLRRIYKY
jgi:hypothetical protein